MTIWQNTNGELYDDMDGSTLSLETWPKGMVQLTDTQVSAIRQTATAAPVPQSITRPQCAAQMLVQGLVTQAEGIAMAATGTPPGCVEAIFAPMPQPDQALARIAFASPTYERGNTLFNTIMTSLGHDTASVDAFFRAAANR